MAIVSTVQESEEREVYCAKHDLFSCVFCAGIPKCDDCGSPEPIVASYGTSDKVVGLCAGCDARALASWIA